MKISTAIVALAGMITLVVLAYAPGGAWALLAVGLLTLAGAALYSRAPVQARPQRRRRRKRKPIPLQPPDQE